MESVQSSHAGVLGAGSTAGADGVGSDATGVEVGSERGGWVGSSVLGGVVGADGLPSQYAAVDPQWPHLEQHSTGLLQMPLPTTPSPHEPPLSGTGADIVGDTVGAKVYG